MLKRLFHKMLRASEQEEQIQNRRTREAWVDQNSALIWDQGYHGTTTVARNEEQMVKALATLGSLPPGLQQKFHVVVSSKHPGLVLIGAKDHDASSQFRKKLGFR